MKRKSLICTLIGACAIYLLYACGSSSASNHAHKTASDNEVCAHNHDHAHDHNHAHGHDTPAEHSDSGDEIVLSKESAFAAGVTVETVTAAPFQYAIKTAGKILSSQSDETTIVATTSGIVSLKNNLLEGKEVERGSTLLTISAKKLAEGDPIVKARIAYETAKREYDRVKPLAESKIVSEKELSRATEAYENARVNYEALAQHHSSGGQGIVASMTGYVKSVMVKEGDYVQLGQPLVQITRNKRLYLRAEVSEKYYAALRTVNSANFITSYDSKVYAMSELNGKLLSMGKTPGNDSFYIPVTFEFDNKGDILPGSYVEVYLLSAPLQDVIALPHSAITEEQGLYFVYLQADEECYTKQQVVIGEDNGKMVEIRSGLTPGDRVVVTGAQRVKLATAGNAIPAHSH